MFPSLCSRQEPLLKQSPLQPTHQPDPSGLGEGPRIYIPNGLLDEFVLYYKILKHTVNTSIDSNCNLCLCAWSVEKGT